MSPTPFVRTILPALLAATAAALAGVALLHVLPFLARLDALGQHSPTAAEWAGFVEAAFVLGGLCGLTSLIPLKAVRFAMVMPLVALAGFYLALSAIEQTLSSMKSGDSLLALIFMSPILLAVGISYLLIVAALIVGLILGAGLLKAAVQPLPPIAQGAALAGAVLVAILLLGPALRTPADAAPPAPSAPPPERPIPLCDDPPFSVELGRSPLISARQTLPSESVVLFYVTVDQSDWTPQNILDGAESALNGHRQCRVGSTVWTPHFQLAQPRPITLRLRVTRNRQMQRRNQEMMLRSHLTSLMKSSLQADPAAPEYFVTRIREQGLTDDAVELLGCEPAAADLICESDRLSVRVPGVYPLATDIKIDWGKK